MFLNYLFNSHLPGCGASMTSLKIGLDIIVQGQVDGEEKSILIVDPRAKFDFETITEFVDESFDRTGCMIDIGQIMKNISIGKETNPKNIQDTLHKHDIVG